MSTSKQNPKKLERLHKELPEIDQRLKGQLKTMKQLTKAMLEDYEQLSKLLDETELVNARGIKPLVEDLRSSYESVLNNSSIDGLLTQLNDCEQSFNAFSNYYKTRYLATIERTSII